MSTSDRSKPPPRPAAAPGSPKSSGRVTHDARGNPVWEWQTSTGVFTKDASTQSLKKLEAPGLSLMDTQTVVKAKPRAPGNAVSEQPAKAPTLDVHEPSRAPVGGFNPYNHDGKPKLPKRAAVDVEPQLRHPALAHKQKAPPTSAPRQSLQTKYASRQPAAPAKPSGWLARVKRWFGR